MVIYSGFSSRKLEDKYNHLIKQLLTLLSQMIITYVDSKKVLSFRYTYQKIHEEFCKLDAQKYSDLKLSIQLEPLTSHILMEESIKQTISEPPKKKFHQKHHGFRMRKSLVVETPISKTLDLVSKTQKKQKRKSPSNFHEKQLNRRSVDKIGAEYHEELTMEELMMLNPLIERKMSGFRKKRYLRERQNNFPQIREEEEFAEEEA